MDSRATDRITLIKDVSKLDDAVQAAVKRGGPRRIAIFDEKGGSSDLVIYLRDIDIPLEIAGLGCKVGRLDIAGCRSVEFEGFNIVPEKDGISTVSRCEAFRLLKGTLEGRIDISDVNDVLIEGTTVMMRNGVEPLNLSRISSARLSKCNFLNPEPKEALCWCHAWRSTIHAEGCISHGRRPRYGIAAEDESTVSGDNSVDGWLSTSYYSWDSLPKNIRDTMKHNKE